MGFIFFIGAVIITGLVATLVRTDPKSTRNDAADYHYPPYAGDALGHNVGNVPRN